MSTLIDGKTAVFERGDFVYFVSTVAPFEPAESEIEEFSFGRQIREMAPNPNLLWLHGTYVEGGVANDNGQEWSAEDLAIKSLTPIFCPVTVMHDPKSAVGLIANTKLIPGDAAGPTRIDNTLALWAHRFPEVAQEVAVNHSRGSLMQSQECVPLDTEILTRRGWRRYDELREGDETVGYNAVTRHNEWTPILSVHCEDAAVVSMGHRRWRVRCTPNHRWLAGRPRRVGSKIEWQAPAFVRAEDLRTEQLVLSAPANLDGDLPISPEEAALIGWIACDGSFAYKTAREFKACIYQSKPDGVMAVELALSAAQMPHKCSVRSRQRVHLGRGYTQNHEMHTFRLPGPRAHELWRRAELDHLSWPGFVLRLGDAARSAFLHACFLAEGSDNRGSWVIAHLPGPLKDAIALAGYLEGARPTDHGEDNRGDSSLATSHVRLCRAPVNADALALIHLGIQPVWCPQTGLGTWTMRQDGNVMLTGNCRPAYWECGPCGQRFLDKPAIAEHQGREHSALSRKPVRKLGNVTFTGTGLVFGTRGARGALSSGQLDLLEEEVAEFHERSRERQAPKRRTSRAMDIEQKDYEALVAKAGKVDDLEVRVRTAEETAVKVPELEKRVETLEVEKKALESERDTEKSKREGLEETARAATLSGERMGKLGKGFVAKLPDSVKVKLEEQAKSLSDEDWTGRLDELSAMMGGTKSDDPGETTSTGNSGATGTTFSREETSQTQTGAGGGNGGNGSDPSRAATSQVVGGLLHRLGPQQKKPEPAGSTN